MRWDTLIEKKWWLGLLVFVTALGVFLRLYHLGDLPAVMHRDEQAIAYNAYSVLQTGRDEWGVSNPLIFRSFDDYKLPGMVYTTAIGIKLFGFSPFGSRVMMALLAGLAVPMAFGLAQTLFKSKMVGLLVATLLAVSFWHLAGSRNIYEPVAVLTLTIPTYWTLFLAGKKPLYLFLSLGLFFVSLWFYNTPLFLYPLLFLFWGGWQWRGLSAEAKRWWLSGLLVLVLMAGGTLLALRDLSSQKSETTLFFSQSLQDEHQSRLDRYWKSGVPLFAAFTKAERAYQLTYTIYQGYVRAIDPAYLFFNGGNNAWHNLSNLQFGDINPVLLPLFIWGLVVLVKSRKRAEAAFMLAWLVISPIANALTVDSPNTNRLIDLHFVVMVIATYGFWSMVTAKKLRFKRALIGILIIAYGVVTLQFLARYFLLFNKTLHPDWQEGLPQTMQEVVARREQYKAVLLDFDVPAMYMFYAFYTQYSPQQLQVAQQQGAADFGHIGQLDNVYLRFSAEKAALLADPASEKVLVVVRAEQVPETKEPVFIITDWEGTPRWAGYEWPLTQEGQNGPSGS